MPDIPPEAIRAAVRAIDDFPRKGLEVKWEDYQPELARFILEAATPVIARDALLSLAAEFEERARCCGTDVVHSGWQAAARVARDAATRHQEPLGEPGTDQEIPESVPGPQESAERAGEQS